MPANLQRLNRYDPAATLARPGAQVLAWLTGQSSYQSACLSPEQANFLQEAGSSAWVKIAANFPYNREASSADYQGVSLPLASLRNGAQFAAALGSAAFGRACARHLQPLLDAASSRLALLCGSCGLQLFYAALPLLRVPAGLRIQLVGLGPVCLRYQPHPQIAVTVVQGRRDRLSRSLCRLPGQHYVAGGHLDYTASPEVIKLVKQLLAYSL